MTEQFRSQSFGLGLAFATALGCIAYERLVKTFCFATVASLVCISYLPFVFYGYLTDNTVKTDVGKLGSQKWYILLYLLSGITCFFWYTRRQSVAVGAVYEVKYIVMLAIMYLLFGVRQMTWNMAIGIFLAMVSIYFISK